MRHPRQLFWVIEVLEAKRGMYVDLVSLACIASYYSVNLNRCYYNLGGPREFGNPSVVEI